MAVRIESMAEPLPGYRLIERLGGGGFGEVWKAEAPGGLFKAIKFVYGDLEAVGEEGARAGQEFKALKRVITVRHPFILSLERFDVIDGQLLIVTELADRTLWDRFRECRDKGLQGIDLKRPVGAYVRFGKELEDLSGAILIPVADQPAFLDLLDNPPAPTQALLQAASKRKKRHG